jgi:hypothetical protein
MLLIIAFSELTLMTPVHIRDDADHGYIRADPDHTCIRDDADHCFLRADPDHTCIRSDADHGYIRADPDHTCIRGVADNGYIRNEPDHGFIKDDPDLGLIYPADVGLILITGETDDMTGDYLALVLNDGYVELR